MLKFITISMTLLATPAYAYVTEVPNPEVICVGRQCSFTIEADVPTYCIVTMFKSVWMQDPLFWDEKIYITNKETTVTFEKPEIGDAGILLTGCKPLVVITG